MKLQFKHQPFQEAAAQAVCDVFQGQPNQVGRYLVDHGFQKNSTQQSLLDSVGYNNAHLIPELDNSILRENLHKVQDRGQIFQTDVLSDGINLTVEMETGVGKTYTYIKTMYELNKQYGWTKFIIVVPSVAIREGVYKTFQTTEDHFAVDYGKRVRYFIYNSKNLSQLDTFANDAGINVMIINAQAFNARGKDANRIRRKLDEFRSRRPIDVVAATNPILIIDEPQSVEGPKTEKALKDFHALFTLRYSATPKKDYNVVYRLDAIDAYNMNLVKKISVKGITASGSTATEGYVYLDEIQVSKTKPPVAILRFDVKGKQGVRQVSRKVDEGFKLFENSRELEEYRDGYTVTGINANTKTVEFANGIILHPGEVIGDVSESQIRRLQIRETIISHIECEQRLFEQGIKVLSLFFIDEVAKYRLYDKGGISNGEYAEMFEEEYQDIVQNMQGILGDENYVQYLNAIPVEKTHQGYFSMDKKGHIVDSKGKGKEKCSDDVDAYDLIMKNKELLLDQNPRRSPVRFIFSHSALREGWDNPNVFQICTLKQSSSETRKRQEVGRGMRLCVNQNGERMDEARLGREVHGVNLLTVIASESYKDFASGLQDEMAKAVANRPTKVDATLFENKTLLSNNGKTPMKVDSGTAGKIFISLVQNGYIDADSHLTSKYKEDRANGAIKVAGSVQEYSADIIKILDTVYDGKYAGIENGKDNNTVVNLDKDKIDRDEFKELWSRINHKSVYAVDFNSEELVRKAVQALDEKLRVAELYFTVETGHLDAIQSKEALEAGKAFIREVNGMNQHKAKVRVNNGIKYDLVGKLVNDTGLTRKAIVAILTGVQATTFQQFKNNPEEFIIKASQLINEEKATSVIEHITYCALDETYDTDIFTIAQVKAKLDENAIAVDKSIYDHVIYDSTNEREFASNLESDNKVVVYVKLPDKFFIDTPVGHYNPDWAIAFKTGLVKHVYFIAETKGSMSSMQLRLIEKSKISCARKHFKAISGENIVYDVVDSYKSLLEKVMK